MVLQRLFPVVGSRNSTIRKTFFSVVLAGFAVSPAVALDEKEVEREIRFARELNKMGLSDYAQRSSEAMSKQ